MHKCILFILGLVFSLSIFSQKADELYQQEQVLDSLLTALRTAQSDESIDRINSKFKEEIIKTFELENAFDYPFTSLKSIGKIYSQDGLVRIISWNTQHVEDLAYDYFAFILKKDERTGKVSVSELKRGYESLKMQQFETINAENWYGALYYEIIDVKKRRKTYYTLLGYYTDNTQSHIKFIDVLYFTGKIPHLGFELFGGKDGQKKRLLFEHSIKATMSMRYDKEREKIIMDHLSPESESLREFREFYVPDMSYDAYEWNGKEWTLIEDVVAINKEKGKTLKVKAYDPNTDSVIDVQIKNKWEDPNGGHNPIGGEAHKAVIPDDIKAPETKKEKKKKEAQPIRGNEKSNIQLEGQKKKSKKK